MKKNMRRSIAFVLAGMWLGVVGCSGEVPVTEGPHANTATADGAGKNIVAGTFKSDHGKPSDSQIRTLILGAEGRDFSVTRLEGSRELTVIESNHWTTEFDGKLHHLKALERYSDHPDDVDVLAEFTYTKFENDEVTLKPVRAGNITEVTTVKLTRAK
jgi:hypothetical protein